MEGRRTIRAWAVIFWLLLWQAGAMAIDQRIILVSPLRVLIFDEPTSGLDYAHMLEVSRLLRELAERGLCVLVITHDGEFLRESGARAVSWLSEE